MPRRFHFLGFIAVTLAAVVLAWQSAPGANRPAKSGRKQAERAERPLPLAQVVLFNNGVGYFQREGTVEGDAKIDLSFPASDINDLLKSLVLQDLGQGRINVVSLDSSEPIEKNLKSFALDLTGNPTFGQIANQARGEAVEVGLQGGGAASVVTGTIVGMEAIAEGNKEVHNLNLLCTEGMRTIPLGQIQRLRFLNAMVDAEFRGALGVLSTSRDSQKKAVSFHFTGEGKRDVRVGYVVESPLWKTSYRLVFDKAGNPSLQTWAIIENTTDEDWKDIRLALVSGRPMSFQMDLYPPLFVPRPKVEPELFASLRPPMYAGQFSFGSNVNLGAGGGNASFGGQLGMQLGGAVMPHQENRRRGPQLNGSMVGGSMGGQGGMVGNRYQPMGFQGGSAGIVWEPIEDGDENTRMIPRPREPAPRLTMEDLRKRREESRKARNDARQFGSALAAVDTSDSDLGVGNELGDSFQHVLEQKVTVARQKTALLPIQTSKVEGERVSIYSQAVHPRFPLRGLKFKNTTGKPLMQGPIMVYEGDRYAGDARIADLQADEERLLSYAMDLGVEISSTDKETIDQKLTLSFDQAVMRVGYTTRSTKTYTIRNHSKQPRVIILVQPIREGWTLAGLEKPYQTVPGLYRFRVEVPAGQTKLFDTAEEQPRTTIVRHATILQDGDSTTLGFPRSHDLDVEITRQIVESDLAGLTVAKGAVRSSTRKKVLTNHRVRNVDTSDREITLTHTLAENFKLVGDAKPVQGTIDQFKFVHRVPKDGKAEQTVAEQGTEVQTIQLGSLNEERAKPFLARPVVGQRVKAVIGEALRLRAAYEKTTQEINEAKREIQTIHQEQARLRENLSRLPSSSAAYKRYLDKFDAQEPQLENLTDLVKRNIPLVKKQEEEYARYTNAATAE